MSCLRLQPPRKIAPTATNKNGKRGSEERLIILHLAHVFGVQRLQKTSRFGDVELGIARLNAQEKTVAAGVLRKTVHVKERVMRLWKPVQRQHAKNRGQRGAQHSQLKGHGNKCRPAIQRAAA